MADYPEAITNLTNPLSTDKMNSPSHSEQHSNANDEIKAIETELGINPSGSGETVKARLDTNDTAVGLNTTHRTNNTQAHSDYLINNGDDTTSGTITAAGFSGPLTGNVTGDVSGQAGTVATITGLAPDTQNTYARTQYLIPYASSTTAWGQIAIGTSGQVLTSGGAGVAPSFEDAAIAGTRGTFVDGDLSTGVLTITHSLGLSTPFTLNLTVADNSQKMIIPDDVTFATNTITVDLTSYGTLTGTWGYYYA